MKEMNPDEIPMKKRRVRNKNDSKAKPDQKIDKNEDLVSKNNKKQRQQPQPKFRLKTVGQSAALDTAENERVPLVLTDIQHLLLHSLMGNLNLSEMPRWYVLDKGNKITHTCCLVLEGLSINHWAEYKAEFLNTKQIFKDIVEILTPSVYGGSLVQELALVPLSEAEKEGIIQKYGSMNLALEARKDLMVMMRAVFPISNEETDCIQAPAEDMFPRTQLIMSAWQLIEEGYPLPLKGKLEKAYSDYVMTKDEYKPVTPKSPLFAIDCEMCITNAGSELTHISIVNEKHEVIYESHVKPYNEITDYLTRYSGVTKKCLENITKRLEDVQKDIKEQLPSDAILVGQSLNLDLHALKMMHPYIIDTSLIYNFTGERNRKPKLKTLAREFLRQDIQTGQKGHNPVEDSLASLKLVQLKLGKYMEFGDAVHENRKKYKENYCKTTQDYGLSIFNHMIERKKTSLVVGCDDITGDYHTYLSQAKENVSNQLKRGKPKKLKLITVDDQQEAITTLTQAVSEYNFTMAHLKLESNGEKINEKIETINKWIDSVWKNIPQSCLFVVVLGGAAKDNGLAMIKIKNY